MLKNELYPSPNESDTILDMIHAIEESTGYGQSTMPSIFSLTTTSSTAVNIINFSNVENHVANFFRLADVTIVNDDCSLFVTCYQK